MYSRGRVGGYAFEVKLYKKRSKYGIDGGKIQKLSIYRNSDGAEVYFYDKGYRSSKEKMQGEFKEAYDQILEWYN